MGIYNAWDSTSRYWIKISKQQQYTNMYITINFNSKYSWMPTEILQTFMLSIFGKSLYSLSENEIIDAELKLQVYQYSKDYQVIWIIALSRHYGRPILQTYYNLELNKRSVKCAPSFTFYSFYKWSNVSIGS